MEEGFVADPYIDQNETLIYGKFAREQMKAVCLGKIPELDGMVKFAIVAQEGADAEMKVALEKQPKPAPSLDAAAVLEEVRDTVVRFGSWIDSLKGRPLDPRDFFGGDAPSVLARRRIVKLTAAVGHLLDELTKQASKAPGTAAWIAELDDAFQKLSKLEKTQRAAKLQKVEMAPEVAAARLRWLDVYSANKLLVRGLLAHAGKVELMPLVFDDLAEIHRASGVTDDAGPTPALPDATP